MLRGSFDLVVAAGRAPLEYCHRADTSARSQCAKKLLEQKLKEFE